MTLYHYCSAATFESIVSKKSIWLSSLSQSNDTHEGVWMDGLLRQVCLENDFSPSEIERVSEFLKDATAFWDVLGFCLTPNEDMLSQWRGYADDGCGFAIGFSEEAFRCVNRDKGGLFDVIYEKEMQLEIVRERVKNNLELLRSGIRTIPSEIPKSEASKKAVNTKNRFRSLFSGPRVSLSIFFLSLIDIMYVLKNPSFREETETRFITNMNREYPGCEFHRSGRKLVPHRVMEFSSVKPALVIEKVVLGPGNPTPPDIVAAFLRENGFGDAEIFMSAATYRSRF